MKYGVSIGRRQPMHRLHVDCIREIVDAGLEPIIIVGSTNGAESPLFDPLKNPLTYEQQVGQIKAALPFLKNPTILPLPDLGHLQHWCESVVALLGDKTPQSLMHYRTKTGDEGLSASEPIFAQLGLKSWKTANKNPEDDNVSSSNLRELPLNELLPHLAAPDYIEGLIESARAEHNWLDFPLSMLDLTLSRLEKETRIASKTLLPEGKLTLEQAQNLLSSRRRPGSTIGHK